MLLISTTIELAQFFVISGRDSTVGDVFTNTVGGAIGFAAARSSVTLQLSPGIAKKLTLSWAALWLALQVISCLGLSLSLPDTRYYGQIARALGNFTLFQGRVLAADIGGVAIPNGAIPDSRQLRRHLIDGNAVNTTAVLAGNPSGVAAIVRVADERQREILLVGQRGDGFAFGLHLGAAMLRLRSPLFLLQGAFPPSLSTIPRGDTVRLYGRFSAGEIRMRAETSVGATERSFPITASLGWTLWLPFQWLIEGSPFERGVSWMWMACLMIPLGYGMVSVRQSMAKPTLATDGILLMSTILLVVTGLALIPRLFGLVATPKGDWITQLVGLLVGGLLAKLGDTQRAWSVPAVNGQHRS